MSGNFGLNKSIVLLKANGSKEVATPTFWSWMELLISDILLLNLVLNANLVFKCWPSHLSI